MQTDVDSGMLLEVLDKRQVRSFVGLFEDVLEIAAGLMGVDEKSKMKFLRHGDSLFPLTMIARCGIL
jgi:hypothetical protein